MITAKQLKAALIKRLSAKNSLVKMSKFEVISLVKDTYVDLIEGEIERLTHKQVLETFTRDVTMDCKASEPVNGGE